MATRVGQAGNSGPEFSPLPIPPSIFTPSRPHPDPYLVATQKPPTPTPASQSCLPPTLSRLRWTLSPGSTKQLAFKLSTDHSHPASQTEPQTGREDEIGSCHRGHSPPEPRGQKVREEEEVIGPCWKPGLRKAETSFCPKAARPLTPPPASGAEAAQGKSGSSSQCPPGPTPHRHPPAW